VLVEVFVGGQVPHPAAAAGLATDTVTSTRAAAAILAKSCLDFIVDSFVEI